MISVICPVLRYLLHICIFDQFMLSGNMTLHKGSNYGYNQRNKTEDQIAHFKTQVLNITKSPHKGHFKVTLSIVD